MIAKSEHILQCHHISVFCVVLWYIHTAQEREREQGRDLERDIIQKCSHLVQGPGQRIGKKLVAMCPAVRWIDNPSVTGLVLCTTPGHSVK